jgi:hypothetical protein
MLSMLLLIDEQLSRSMYFFTSKSVSGESNEVDRIGSVSVRLMGVPPIAKDFFSWSTTQLVGDGGGTLNAEVVGESTTVTTRGNGELGGSCTLMGGGTTVGGVTSVFSGLLSVARDGDAVGGGGESVNSELNDWVWCLVRISGLAAIGADATGEVSFNKFGSLTVTTRNRELGKKVGELPVDVGDRDGSEAVPGEAGSLTLTTRKRLLLRDGLGTGDDIGLGIGLTNGERSGVDVDFFESGSSRCWAWFFEKTSGDDARTVVILFRSLCSNSG